MENRDRDKMSQRNSSTQAGDINRGVSKDKSDSSVDFGQNIGQSESGLNEPSSRTSGSVGSGGMQSGSGGMQGGSSGMQSGSSGMQGGSSGMQGGSSGMESGSSNVGGSKSGGSSNVGSSGISSDKDKSSGTWGDKGSQGGSRH
jgi:hypothetical protein